MRVRAILTLTAIALATFGFVPAHASDQSRPVVLIAQGEELDVYTPGEATISRGADALVTSDQWVNGTPCFFPRGSGHEGEFVEADDAPNWPITEPDGTVSNGDKHPFWGIFHREGEHFVNVATIPDYNPTPTTFDQAAFDLGLTDPAGCLFQPGTANLIVTDVGDNHTPTQGNGKLIEFFQATDYSTFCVLDPTISQAGFPTFATDGSGDLLVPHTGEGSIYRYAGASLPHSGADCAGSGHLASVTKNPWLVSPAAGTPIAIVPDPRGGYAVSSVIAPSDVVHVYDLGQAGVVDGVIAAPSTQTGTPFGLAFAPNKDLYYADLGITVFPGCQQNPTDPTCLTDPIDSAGGQSSLMIAHPGDNEIIPWVACDNCANMDFADGIAVVPASAIDGD